MDLHENSNRRQSGPKTCICNKSLLYLPVLRSGTTNFISWLTGERSTWEEDKSDIDPNCATAFVYNPRISLSFEQQRESLPVFKNRNHILYLLEKFQTLVLVGETGCGKSTQVPQVRL